MYTTLRCPDQPPQPPQVELIPVAGRTDSGRDGVRLRDQQLQQTAERLIQRPECTGETGGIWQESTDAGRVVLLGIGPADAIEPDRVRAAADALIRQLHAMHVSHVRLNANRALEAYAGSAAIAEALAEGAALAAFRFDLFKGKAPEQPPAQSNPPGILTWLAEDQALRRAIQIGLESAESTNYTRHLAALPPNIATPYYLADEARKLARTAGLKCAVWQDQALHKWNMVGLINVGKASEHQPCLIELVYEPTDEPTATLVLVGKTITFDSGGLSLKINDTMRYMKYDKAAGCAVLGAMHAIAQLKPRCRVVGLLPAAENAISDAAYRVDDILQFPNGVSVEVTNTDYEGRLVMADALIHGCQAYKPDTVVDLGTLTGEIITALGRHTAGLWTNNVELESRLETAAQQVGDPVWPMPLNAEHHRAIDAPHADIVNLGLASPGKPSQCAAFLSRFVPQNTPWAHLDVAGPVHVETPTPPFAVGPTGFGTRLLTQFVAAWD